MAFEIDFIGHQEIKDDYDAICFRFWDNVESRFVNCVFDGGFVKCGETLHEHMKKYYLDTQNNLVIDYVFCSHGDQDHAAGLEYILRNCSVKTLVVNFPWDYCDVLFPQLSDGRITKDSLRERLFEKYSYLATLKTIAQQKDIKIVSGLTELTLHNQLKIISPSREFYIKKLVESDKTPAMDNMAAAANECFAGKLANKIKENWNEDSLREDVTTTADNESSIILYGTTPKGNFLLTGDAGKEALTEAINYSKNVGKTITGMNFYQIPHHGGRHNVTPTVLNQLIGPIKPKGTSATMTAFVSVGKDSDHPRKMVVNAFTRRGCKVYTSSTSILHHHWGEVPNRGWGNATAEEFSDEVENWNN